MMNGGGGTDSSAISSSRSCCSNDESKGGSSTATSFSRVPLLLPETTPLLGMTPATKSCCRPENQDPSLLQAVQQAQGSNNKNSNNRNNNNNSNSMNETSNVLVQYTLQDLNRRAETNFWLGLICLGTCAINMVLIYLNWTLHRDTTNDNDDGSSPASKHYKPHVSHRTFHLLEFWTSHVYAIAEAFALVTSPKTMLHIYDKPNLLKLLLFFNVVNSLVPALLMTLDSHYFETVAHELEFINSFTLSFITMILVASLLKDPPSLDDQDSWGLPSTASSQHQQTVDYSSILMGLAACVVAVTNFVVYNVGFRAPAHYLEFSFNVVVSLITFWFCMDNRFVAQMEIGQILYGKHANCIFCQIRTHAYQMNLHEQQHQQSRLFSMGAVVGDPEGEEEQGEDDNDDCCHHQDTNMMDDELTPLMGHGGATGGGGGQQQCGGHCC